MGLAAYASETKEGSYSRRLLSSLLIAPPFFPSSLLIPYTFRRLLHMLPMKNVFARFLRV